MMTAGIVYGQRHMAEAANFSCTSLMMPVGDLCSLTMGITPSTLEQPIGWGGEPLMEAA